MKEGACKQCIDCYYHDVMNSEEGNGELCFFDPNNPVEVNYYDPACPHFELSETAFVERVLGQ